MKFAQNIHTKKLSFEKAEKEQKKILSKIEELAKRSQSKSSQLKDKNREKMKLVANNATELYNFRNKIINEIKKEKGEYVKHNKEIKGIKKIILHRPEEELKDLIKNIEEDTDLENEFYLKIVRELNV